MLLRDSLGIYSDRSSAGQSCPCGMKSPPPRWPPGGYRVQSGEKQGAYTMARTELWMEKPETHDYAAAKDYLSLLLEAKQSAALIERLRRAPLVRRMAKDILRAGRLQLLPRNDPHVVRELKKIRKGKRLSPVLLVRGDVRGGVPLTIADGYHRICASWYIDEDAVIPCRVASSS